ncbi:copper homeostasis protein cutC homolog [Leptinotarsa decemlineata]|uniref:copper homeostasis protein cutC homolog n=1 Tax=Leptinotarsa decemlineata TaxID=7539 RepID=UPI000C253340|nr:copper homeostasis protein cutC homolog [Leptinotarsa decemlineata]
MKMTKVILEVCVDSVESAVAAVAGGADRLELCSSLVDGGLTPTPGFLIQCKNLFCQKNISFFCLIRCRPGNFIYDHNEVEIMKEDAKILRKHGADGFVFGALSENGDVNMKICREIIRVCHPLPVTFHRAFDFCKRPTIEVEVIIDLGFERILTSGKQQNAQLGVKLIQKLMEQVGNRIIIMPGGGITKDNVKYILENTEAKEIHGSFKSLKEETETTQSEEDKVPIGERQGSSYVTSESTVSEIVDIIKNV